MIERIAVVGAGYMGGGITQVFAMAGLHVVIVDADPALTARHLDRLRLEADDFENRGLFTPGSADLVRKNVRPANSVPEAVAEADFIEEAVLERPEVKKPVLRSIEAAARPDAVIGSNTSALPIGDLAADLEHLSASSVCTFPIPRPLFPAWSSLPTSSHLQNGRPSGSGWPTAGTTTSRRRPDVEPSRSSASWPSMQQVTASK